MTRRGASSELYPEPTEGPGHPTSRSSDRRAKLVEYEHLVKDTTASRNGRRSGGQRSSAPIDATHLGTLAEVEAAGDEAAPLTIVLTGSGDVERVGRYEVRGVLGRGGMGVVYEVFDPKTHKSFALKTIETRFLELADGAAEHRFRHEIKVLQRLEHPGIVRLFETGLARHPMGYQLAYYVMERLEGETLVKDIKASKRFQVEEAVRVTVALAEALDYLHQNGVLHRDIKPGNIFLEKNGRVILLDFGLARSDEFTRLTLAGQIVGTFSYMSPERLCGLKVDVSADVFAVGVVMFQMLAGRHPFGSGSPTDLMAAIQRGIEWPDTILNLDKGAELQSLLSGMLAMEAKNRPSPTDVARRAKAITRKIPAQHTPSGPSAAARRPQPPAATVAAQTVARAEAVAPATVGAPTTARPISPSHTPSAPIVAHPRPTIPNDTSQEAHLVQPISSQGMLPQVATQGPSWTVVALITGSMTCFAFTLGLLIGSSRAPDRSTASAEPDHEIVAAPPPVAPQAPPIVDQRPIAPLPAPVEEPEPEKYGDAKAAFAAAERQISAGQHQAAIRSLKRTLELNPAFADAHRRLGDAHRAINEVDRAMQHYKMYLVLRPEAGDAPAVKSILNRLSGDQE
jgi:serine/threonine protein kinase